MSDNFNSNATGRVFLAPQPLELPQIWINIGYDSHDGFKCPEYLEEFQVVCSKEQYDNLMKDVKLHFEKNSIKPCCARIVVLSVFIPPLLFFTIPYSERRRREFDAGFDRIIRKHQKYWLPENSTKDFSEIGSVRSSASSATRRGSVEKKNVLLKWAYGFPLPISPHQAYDHDGNVLKAKIETGGNRRRVDSAWPPPYYNIILTIPQGYHYRVRHKWPGEVKIMNNNEKITPAYQIEKTERERLAEGLQRGASSRDVEVELTKAYSAKNDGLFYESLAVVDSNGADQI